MTHTVTQGFTEFLYTVTNSAQPQRLVQRTQDARGQRAYLACSLEETEPRSGFSVKELIFKYEKSLDVREPQY
jgi:hypothetical protein